jgi:lauroyl/myristoyl acyltransferase
MSAKWIIAALWLAVFAPAPAAADTLGAGDRQAIRSIIQSQLGAFRRDDGHEAFSYASPGIRQMFQTAEIFMAMVRGGYAAVYRPRAVEFLETLVKDGRTVQMMRFIGPDGVAVIAMYTMERQPDGSWRIDGVVLLRTEETVS